MNHLYRIVWNAHAACWQAVSEIAKGRGKSTERTQSTGLYDAVSSGNRAVEPRLRALVLAVAAALIGLSAPSYAGPEGGNVVRGSASISSADKTTTINQSSDRAVINWSRFSVAADEAVRFNQPSRTSATLNRVTGAERSDIMGSLSANGHVFLINPNGVLIGAGAQVNVGGFIASSLDMDDDDFMSGKINLKGESVEAVTNDGEITAEEGGTVVLIATEVNNNGSITANQGSVVLAGTSSIRQTSTAPVPVTESAAMVAPTTPTPAPVVAAPSPVPATPVPVDPTVTATVSATVSTAPAIVAAPTPSPAAAQIASGGGNTAEQFTLRLQDGSNIAFTIDQGAVNALVNNRGLIKAPGGHVILTAKGRDELSKATVNHSGVIEAQTLTTRNGVVELLADMTVGTVNLSGAINAAAVAPMPAPTPTTAEPTLRGGFVETSAATVMIADSARVNTLGSMASGIRHGNWLIDPQDFTIAASGGNVSGATLAENLKTGDVTIDTLYMGTPGGNGDIFIKEYVGIIGPGISEVYYDGGRTWDGSSPTRLTLIADRNIVFSPVPEEYDFYGGAIDFINGEVDLQPNARGATGGKIYVDEYSDFGYAVRANNIYLSTNNLGSGLQRGSTQIDVNVLDQNQTWQSVPMGLDTLGGISPAPANQTKTTLYVTAIDATKTYDKIAWSGGTVNYLGFLSGDNAGIFSGGLTWTGTAQGAINAGTYSLNPTGLSLTGSYATKYEIKYTPGILTIDPARLMIIAQVDSKTYDGTVASNPTPVVTGLVAGDKITGLRQVFSSKDVAGEKGSQINPVFIDIVGGNLSSQNPNYRVITVARDATIYPKPIRAIDVSVVDGESNINVDSLVAQLDGWSAFGIVLGDSAKLMLDSAYFRSKYVGSEVLVDAYWSVVGGDARNYIVTPSVHSGKVVPSNTVAKGICYLFSACGYDDNVISNVNAAIGLYPENLKNSVDGTINEVAGVVVDAGEKLQDTHQAYADFVRLYLQDGSGVSTAQLVGATFLAIAENAGTVGTTVLELISGSAVAKSSWHTFVDVVASEKSMGADWAAAQKENVDNFITAISLIKGLSELKDPITNLKNVDLDELAKTSPRAKYLIDNGIIFRTKDGALKASSELGKFGREFVADVNVASAIGALGLTADIFDFVSK